MRLFDGSEDYEIGNYSVTCNEHKPVRIHVNLFKDSNCREEVSTCGTRVELVGKDRTNPDINQYRLDFYMKSLGHFRVHPNSMLDHKRLHFLAQAMSKHPQAELFVNITVRGDDVVGETQMAPFAVQALSAPGKWTHMFYDNTRILDC